MAGKTNKSESIDILNVSRGEATIYIVGTSPLIFNRMSQKGYKELMFPQKKTSADRRSKVKHDPLIELWNSPYTNQDDAGPTYLQGLASWFKQAMAGAATDIPGTSKAQIKRLLYVAGDRIDIYGIPEMFTCITRSADIKRTPDTRTRAIVRHWAAVLRVQYVTPLVREDTVAKLVQAAGMMQGVGDFRIEKGAGNYGGFTTVPDNDAELVHLMNNAGRAAQIDAMLSPAYYDDETQALSGVWYENEVEERGFREQVDSERQRVAREVGLVRDEDDVLATVAGFSAAQVSGSKKGAKTV